MVRWKKALLVGAGVVAVALGFSAWYKAHYSMKPAQAFEVPGTASGRSVLVATQGSRFKDAIVTGLVDHLKEREAHVKVIDVAALPGVNVKDWDAIVVIHTWEMRRPPEPVKAFVDGMGSRGNVIVLTTSGAGDFKMDGIDAISAASRMEDVSARIAEMSARVDAVLASEPRH